MKLALIYSSSDSFWFSSKIIQNNILNMLDRLQGEVELFHFDYSESEDKVELAQKILRSAPDETFFLSHHPHPLELIRALKSCSSEPMTITFQIYGGFISSLRPWCETFQILENDSVQIICGSQAQAHLVEKFIDCAASVIPFAVDEKIFKSQSRQIKKNQRIKFVYTGRLSFEKNIHHLILFLFKAQDNGLFPHGFELSLIGHFDQVYRPLWGEDGVLGSYYFYLMDEIAKEVGRVRFAEQIKFLGPRPQEDLASALQSSDLFISLSTFCFEDYGMSAAEALESGLPALLSSWGGHHGFKALYPDQVELARCEIVDDQAVPLYVSFEIALKKLLANLRYHESRGILSVHQITEKFRDFFQSSSHRRPRLQPFFKQQIMFERIDKKIYKEVYETYLNG